MFKFFSSVFFVSQLSDPMMYYPWKSFLIACPHNEFIHSFIGSTIKLCPSFSYFKFRSNRFLRFYFSAETSKICVYTNRSKMLLLLPPNSTVSSISTFVNTCIIYPLRNRNTFVFCRLKYCLL